MNQQERIQVKNYLLKEKKKLEERLTELKELTKPIAPDCAIGRVSRMDAINNRSINEAAFQKSKDKQKKIDRFLVPNNWPNIFKKNTKAVSKSD